MASASLNVPGARGKGKEKRKVSVAETIQCNVTAATRVSGTMFSQDEAKKKKKKCLSQEWPVMSLGRSLPGLKGIKPAFVTLLASVLIALRHESFWHDVSL